MSAEVSLSRPRRLALRQAFSSQYGGGAAMRMKFRTLMITTADLPRRSTTKRSLCLPRDYQFCTRIDNGRFANFRFTRDLASHDHATHFQ